MNASTSADQGDFSPFILARMQTITRQWAETADQRTVFLSCYALMTANMLAAVADHKFNDSEWVSHLVNRFADHYFAALQDYDLDPATAPRVWRIAHDTCRESDVWAIQKLLLGVNAHINYDLVLTLDELLGPEWAELTESQRGSRHRDYLYVNDIIGRTVDAVQDQVLEPAMPVMRYIDAIMGPGDEALLSRLLGRWRDRVWRYGVLLVEAPDLDAREAVVREMEATALQRASAILMADGPIMFRELFK